MIVFYVYVRQFAFISLFSVCFMRFGLTLDYYLLVFLVCYDLF